RGGGGGGQDPPPGKPCGRAGGEGGKQRLVVSPPLFIRHLAGPYIERERYDVRVASALVARQPQCSGLRGVAVHDQADRGSLMSYCQPVQCEALDPHAGMEQLRLVSGKEERAIAVNEIRLAAFLQVFLCGGERGRAGPLPKLRQRLTENVGRVLFEQVLIGGQRAAHFGQRRLGQDGLIGLRRLQPRNSAHRRGSSESYSAYQPHGGA